MEKLPGQRNNSSIYFYRAEPYHLDTRYKNTRHKYYRCISRSTETQCVASVYVSERGVTTRIGAHSHPIDRYLKEDSRFKEKVKLLTQNVLLEPDEVFREACRQFVDNLSNYFILLLSSQILRPEHNVWYEKFYF